MSYTKFLLLLSQLAGSKKGNIVLGDHLISIEIDPRTNSWHLSTHISSSEGKTFPDIFKGYLSGGFLKWQEKGAQLKIHPKTQSVQLLQTIRSSEKYIPFKLVIEDFSSMAAEWTEILADDFE